MNSGQAAVVAKADGPVRNLADLKGRRLAGVGRGSGMDVLLRGFVLQDTARLRPDSDVSISQLQVGNMNQALETGVVDAAFEWEPFVSQSVLRGTGRVVFDVNKALPNYPWYVIAATTKVVQDRPDDVAKLLRAHHKAVAFLNQQPTEANLIVADAFKLEPIQRPGGDPMPANAVVAEARKRLGWSDTITPSDRAFVQRLMDYSHELGFLPTSLKADQVIDTGPWESAVAATP